MAGGEPSNLCDQYIYIDDHQGQFIFVLNICNTIMIRTSCIVGVRTFLLLCNSIANKYGEKNDYFEWEFSFSIKFIGTTKPKEEKRGIKRIYSILSSFPYLFGRQRYQIFINK